ncbi:FAD-dependent oxidoreductase [Trichlorobacter lovleyi]|uniref:protoporphyrinogen/coproporphyrinogen oxidase n=1 Tax=Trichlorobacter lovleyi TaxID=313985 RepID=UPI002240053D|nr:FAD-dependent oxidoreductase [Trichlorobacter lovleyi]QOX79026.1 FAD-dependent oxidoreductase [Trichlorobacter lovleyi]
MCYHILILGAGPCGLGAAYHLNKLGYTNWQLYERNSYVGGLSASFADDKGFTWDIGGHVLFSHYDCFDNAVAEALGDAYYEHQRESWVRILQTWVPYPFQNNVRHLPDDALRACIEGLRNLKGNPLQATNFREWMDAVFGNGIVTYFMEPYNRKVWGTPLEQMSKDWIAERVSMVDLSRIEKNITEGRDDLSWGPNNTFKFPERGGTGAIYEGIADRFRDKIHLNHEMQEIDLDARQVRFTNGKVEAYDLLITTLPLDLFVKSCVSIPEAVVSAAEGLTHNGGLIVGLGFKGRRDDTKCWMYFPESSSPFYRVTNFHNYSRHNVPGGAIDRHYSLMCETTYSLHKPQDKNSIVDETVQGLSNSGMISDAAKEQIASRYLIDIPYSYPVPTLSRNSALQTIQPYLEDQGVYSRGRFGAWKYEVGNMDHSFMQGVEVVDRILRQGSEPTVNGTAL